MGLSHRLKYLHENKQRKVIEKKSGSNSGMVCHQGVVSSVPLYFVQFCNLYCGTAGPRISLFMALKARKTQNGNPCIIRVFVGLQVGGSELNREMLYSWSIVTQ